MKQLPVNSDELPGELFSSLLSRKKALIDTSSLIYLQHCGMLERLSERISLFTIAAVQQEYHLPLPHITPIVAPCTTAKRSTDQQLIDCAQDNNIPLITEDKKMLLACQRAGIPHFNALMILLFLLFEHTISSEEFSQRLAALKSIARYSTFVWEYGKIVASAINRH